MKNFLLLLLLLLPPAFVLLCWSLFSVNIPYMDDFDAVLKHLAMLPHDRLTDLFVPHNEHRIALTKLTADAILSVRGSFSFRWMMLCGNLFLIAYGFLWLRIFATERKQLMPIGIGMLWLTLSLIHRENMLWGMTSIQNVAVMLFALLALVLSKSTLPIGFPLAILCATLATFASGGGIFVWPCLILCEWFGKRCKFRMFALVAVTIAIALLFILFLPSSATPPHIVQDAPKTGETVIASTTILNFSVKLTPMFIIRHIGYATSLFVSLMGGAAAFPWLCFAFGFVVIGLLAQALSCTREHVGNPVFGFMCFLLLNAVPCAVFRASEFMPCIPSRYCIVGSSILASTLYITKAKLPLRGIGIAMVIFAAVCNVYWLGKMAQRSQNLRQNLLMWPKSHAGLSYPTDKVDSAANILYKCVKKGIYLPPQAKPGETPPTAPLPTWW